MDAISGPDRAASATIIIIRVYDFLIAIRSFIFGVLVVELIL